MEYCNNIFLKITIIVLFYKLSCCVIALICVVPSFFSTKLVFAVLEERIGVNYSVSHISAIK